MEFDITGLVDSKKVIVNNLNNINVSNTFTDCRYVGKIVNTNNGTIIAKVLDKFSISLKPVLIWKIKNNKKTYQEVRIYLENKYKNIKFVKIEDMIRIEELIKVDGFSKHPYEEIENSVIYMKDDEVLFRININKEKLTLLDGDYKIKYDGMIDSLHHLKDIIRNTLNIEINFFKFKTE